MEPHSHKKLVRFMDRLNNLSYHAIFALWAGNIVLFAGIYVVLSYAPGNGPDLAGATDARFWNGLYYSVITATNTGYGDILPIGISRFFAALETISGLFLFAVFVTKLMSRRQDIALRDVHRISFENTFHNIREDLHVVRTDFDHIMLVAEERRVLTEREWDQLTVAYEQITNLIHEIPHFYDTANRLYIIDRRREELLLEAVHRTLSRMNRLLDVLSAQQIDWVAHETSVAKLRELTKTLATLMPVWRERSPYQRTQEFEEIIHLGESIRARIEKALPV